jgi:hypothetical protein
MYIEAFLRLWQFSKVYCNVWNYSLFLSDIFKNFKPLSCIVKSSNTKTRVKVKNFNGRIIIMVITHMAYLYAIKLSVFWDKKKSSLLAEYINSSHKSLHFTFYVSLKNF